MNEGPGFKRPPVTSKAWMPPQTPAQQRQPQAASHPGQRTVPIGKLKQRKKRLASRIVLTILFLTAVLSCGALSFGYYYYSNVHASLANFIRPVTRSANEPIINSTPTYD